VVREPFCQETERQRPSNWYSEVHLDFVPVMIQPSGKIWERKDVMNDFFIYYIKAMDTLYKKLLHLLINAIPLSENIIMTEKIIRYRE